MEHHGDRHPAATDPSGRSPDRQRRAELAELADGLTAAAAYVAAILTAADRRPDAAAGAQKGWAASCQEQLRRCGAALRRAGSVVPDPPVRAAATDPLFHAEPGPSGWVIIDDRLNCPAVIGAQRQENLSEAAALSGAAMLNDFVGTLERRDRAFLAAAQRLAKRLACSDPPGRPQRNAGVSDAGAAQ